jgi:O-antigen/teichoic acid export membrane protein
MFCTKQTMDLFAKKIRPFITPTKANFLWMMLANGIYALCQWGMLIVLAKLGSPEVVGHFALAAAVTAPVLMITNMQLRGVQATDAKKEYFLSDYLSVRMLSTVIALCVVLLILQLGHFGKAAFLATVMLALAKSVESLSDVFYGFFQQQEKMAFMAKSMIIKGILSVAVLGVVFYLSSSLPWALGGLLCAWSLVFMFYDWRMGTKLLTTVEGAAQARLMASSITSFKERQCILFRIVVLAFPLGIVMGIISLNANIPRYAIEKFLGSRELGIFAALAYATVAVNMFIQALGQAVSPRLARHFADGDVKGFKALLRKMILVNLVIGLAGLLLVFLGGEKILTLIYTREYAVYSTLFVVLMISATLSGIASALGYAMTAARQFNLQVPLFVTVLISTGLISFLMIPRYALYGAAIALIASALIQTVGAGWIVQRAIRGRKDGH